MEEKFIVAIEIGSSKIRGALAVVDPTNNVNVLAVQEERISECVRYGQIRNIEEVSKIVDNIFHKLVNVKGVAPRRIEGVYVGLSGATVSASTESSTIKFAEDRDITPDIIRQLMDKAASEHASDKEVYCMVPTEYTVNNEATTKPVGCFGNTIYGSFKLIEGNTVIKNNINRVMVERLHVTVNDYVVTPLAMADAVLLPEEKSLGCVFVDFGAETTTVVIYKGGVLRYLVTLPMGSYNIDRDLTTLNMLPEQAEELKRSTGIVSRADDNLRFAENAKYENYIYARASEIIANVFAQIEYAGYKPADLPSGMIVVGGGARLKGFGNLIAEQTKMKVRLGTVPSSVRISDVSTAVDDAVDVVSILMAVADNAKDCLSFPEPVEVAVEVNPDPVVPSSYEDSDDEYESRIGHIDDDPIEELDGPGRKTNKNNPSKPLHTRRTTQGHSDGLVGRVRERIVNLFKGDIDDGYTEEEDN